MVTVETGRYKTCWLLNWNAGLLQKKLIDSTDKTGFDGMDGQVEFFQDIWMLISGDDLWYCDKSEGKAGF